MRRRRAARAIAREHQPRAPVGTRATDPAATADDASDPTEAAAAADASGPADTAAGPSEPLERPERILTLTDGVVAIAMTLLVLDLNAVDYRGDSPGALWRALTQEGGRFVAFFIAFWVIAQFWLVHHRVFRRITNHRDSLAVRNFWFLFGISVLPFTTRLLGETDHNPLPTTLFAANLLLISLSLTWLSHSATRTGAAAPVTDPRAVLITRAHGVTTVALLVLPGALVWVIPPGTANWLFLLLVLTDVPGRLLMRRRPRPADTAR